MGLLWHCSENSFWKLYFKACRWIYATDYGATDPLTHLKSNLHLLGDFAVCCLDKAARVVDIAPDYIVCVVRLMHQVLWVNLELEFKQNLHLQCCEYVITLLLILGMQGLQLTLARCMQNSELVSTQSSCEYYSPAVRLLFFIIINFNKAREHG